LIRSDLQIPLAGGFAFYLHGGLSRPIYSVLTPTAGGGGPAGDYRVTTTGDIRATTTGDIRIPVTVAGPSGDGLLSEDGNFLVTEDGDFLVLE